MAYGQSHPHSINKKSVRVAAQSIAFPKKEKRSHSLKKKSDRIP
ncbi:hypothetical protein [Moorena sp. SIO3I6]|nr:hypothetical protein [Moorena sp. SIO3I6]